ncbi:MAG TPA: carbohydrate ABC transporter permease [Mobilitalea sp.]|nr:carbohydrate ABC transporter permease [Mobilitalea sp.]
MDKATKRRVIKPDRNMEDIKFRRKVFISRYAKKAMAFFRIATLIGISYIVLNPLISIISKAFFSESDVYNTIVFLIPQNGTMKNFALALLRMDYWKTLGYSLLYIGTLTLIQLFICSLVGYGFARFEFPFKKLLFGCVILTIVIPSYTIMLPLYIHFRSFNPLHLLSLLGIAPQNWLTTVKPIYLMTILGCGLRSGLFIYIFIQFFRGIPKELEEAAFVDGAGAYRTFFTIMLPNAVPSLITVTVFSLVWQYNDSFYSGLFGIRSDYLISVKLASLTGTINSLDKIVNPEIQQLYLDAGIILMVIPIVIIYVLLQRKFIEGVERSGIVG